MSPGEVTLFGPINGIYLVMVPEVLADFADVNGKDVPWLMYITQTLLGREKLKS